jgi:FkbM family methyltransferase
MRKVNVSTIGDMYVYDHEIEAEKEIANYEIFVVNFLMNNAKEDSNFMDIGGYEGYYTLLLGKKIKKGTIYTFEPHFASYDIIKKNIEIHGLNNVKLYHIAMSDKSSNTVLYWRPGAQCVNRIYDFPPGTDNNTFYFEHVSTICLDDLVDDFGRELKIDLMKIDIEGGEVELFRGSRKFFNRNKDCKIVLELHCCNIRNRGINLDNFTKDIGDMFDFCDFSMNKLDMKDIRKCLDTSGGNLHYVIVPR